MVAENADILFEVMTPLGFRVRVTKAYWRIITEIKHSVMRGREEDVKEALRNPDEIRVSKKGSAGVSFLQARAFGALGMCSGKAAQRRRFFDHHLSDRHDQGREASMAEIKVYFDREGNTLTVWFGDPEEEYVCEETGEEVVLMKDKSGKVIGFEKLNFVEAETERVKVAFETVAV